MVLLGNGNEISWVRSCLGTNQFGYEPVWVRTSLGTKSPDFVRGACAEDGLSAGPQLKAVMLVTHSK